MTGNWGVRAVAVIVAGGALALWMAFFGGKSVLSDVNPVLGKPVSSDVIAPVGFELHYRGSTVDSLRQAARESAPVFVVQNPETRNGSLEDIRRTMEALGGDSMFIAGISRNDYYGTGILDDGLLRATSTSDSVILILEEDGRISGTYQGFTGVGEAREFLKRDLMAVFSRSEAESISTLLLPDLLPSESHRDSAMDAAADRVSTVERSFSPGDTLLPAGGIPDEEFFRIYDAMNSSISYPGPLRAAARLVPAVLLILLAVAYGARAMGRVLTSPARVLLLGCIWTSSLACTWLLWQAGSARFQVISFSVFGACLTAVFFDSTGVYHAWFFSLVFSALAGLGSGSPFTAFLVSALPAAFASGVFRQLGERDISLSLMLSVAGSVLVYWALHTAWIGPGYEFDTPVVLSLVLVPLGSVAIARILIHPVEVLFGVTTRLTHARLLSDDHPLRVRLREEARGTYTHSLQVAELAAAAAARLGADPELARMGGFYHDIGKLKQPGMFIENMTDQSYYNPHDYMDPRESAALVIDHVHQGVKLARKYHLPPEVIDIIREHHGTGRTMSFLVKARNSAGPGERIDEAAFRYPGPKPRTVEAALVMTADSASSASRMLMDKNEIAQTVKRTIQEKDTEGQFDQCGLTRSMQDDVWHVFLDILLKTEYERVKDYPHGS
jgi:putative nucleotidyltransferase with HDIG domain